MKIFAGVIVALSVMLMASGCGRSESSGSVPLPRAWPRVGALDSTTVTVECGGLGMTVSRSAEVEHVEPYAVNLHYPALHAVTYLTVRDIADTDYETVWANRVERMALNVGDHETQTLQYTDSTGSRLLLCITPSGCLTPVQMLKVGAGRVLTGATVIEDAAHAPYDSIRPVIEALVAEARRIINMPESK